MNRLVTETVVAYEQSLTDKKINVNLNLEESCFVYADHDSIKRVMINLIDNAIKFTPEEGNVGVFQMAGARLSVSPPVLKPKSSCLRLADQCK